MPDGWNATDMATRLGEVGSMIVMLDCSGCPKVVSSALLVAPPLSLFDIRSAADRCPDIEMRHFAEGDEVTDGHTTVRRAFGPVMADA
jgi:hypothetical protein